MLINFFFFFFLKKHRSIPIHKKKSVKDIFFFNPKDYLQNESMHWTLYSPVCPRTFFPTHMCSSSDKKLVSEGNEKHNMSVI